MAAAALVHDLEDTDLSVVVAEARAGLDQDRSDTRCRRRERVSLLSLHRANGVLRLNEAQCRAEGARLSDRYQNASPFPHVVIDGFLDRDILRDVARAFPARSGKRFFDRDQERLKYQYSPDETDSDLV